MSMSFQDEATEMFEKDDEVRKITQGTLLCYFFSINHICRGCGKQSKLWLIAGIFPWKR